MGKRSDFERRPQDKYYTPNSAVIPLLKHLPQSSTYYEPCAGNGKLINHLAEAGHRCVGASDIDPDTPTIYQKDALDLSEDDPGDAKYFVTNPPWERKSLHPLIEHLAWLRPTWLLIDANWMFTKQAVPFMEYCHKVVTIGRVKWIEDSKMSGKDDAAWFLFDRNQPGIITHFIARAA